MSSELPTIRLQDTLSGKKDVLKTSIPGVVNIYGCGPTVYGYTHVGNARAAISLDLVARTLKYAGYEVHCARNFTDVDDKIIQAALRENKDPQEFAQFFEKAYEDDLQVLGTMKPEFTPRVTESMGEIVDMIEGLISKGFAYSLKTQFGNDVYFRVQSFAPYGKLSKRKLDDLLEGTRAETEEGKEHPGDFALWKAAKAHEPSWKSPWGLGRPGWHIECSAMIHKLFKEPIDIHMGGMDLLFPHHENEIAQSEAFAEKPLAKYWLHNGMLEIDNAKMSKSTGRITPTHEFLKLYGPDCLRFLVLQVHYRNPLDFSDENIHRAEALVDRLYTCKKLALEASEVTSVAELPVELKDLRTRMEESLYDDFNSAKSLGFALAAARVCFRDQRPEFWKAWLKALPILQHVLGLVCEEPEVALKNAKDRKLRRLGISSARAKEIEEALKERERLRAQKNFEASDELRKKLESENILIMDGPDGSSWTVKI